MMSSLKNSSTGWVAAVIVAALATLPFVGSAYITSFAFTVLIAYILAQSWDWVAGEMGYVNLGHYCFYGVGAYAFSIALVGNWPFLISLGVAVAITGMAAALLAVPLFRLHGDYFAFATLALLPLAEILAYNLTAITNGGDGIVLPIAQVLKEAYLLALGICVLAFVVTLAMSKARFGYALKSIRNDEQAAETVGVQIGPVKRRVLVMSACFGAIAGALQAWQMSYIDPTTVFGLNVALVPIAMVLFGGSGLRWGPLVGVLVLSAIQQWLLVNVKGLQVAIYGLTILLIGRFMPGGFLRSQWIRRIPILSVLGREHHEYATESQLLSPAGSGKDEKALPLSKLTADRHRPLIKLHKVRMQFGGNIAIKDISLDIMEGEIVGLIGPNGSGKTTLFNCISGVYTPTAGEILFAGQELSKLRRDQITQLGVGRTYQIPRPFGDLTVLENIAIPLMFNQNPLSPRDAMHEARAFIEYAELSHRVGTRADSLSVQEKKALEFARALACKPRLLLVDEVASGLTPSEIRRFVEHMRHVRDQYGMTVIWVEHIFSALEQVVDRVIVLEQGTVIADGTLAAVVRDERVLSTYLGSTAGTLRPSSAIATGAI